MERIKQALARAREERARTAGTETPARSAVQNPQAILYTQTRSEQASANQLREQRVISAFETGTFTDAYKILSTQVLQKLQANNWNTLAITSPNTGEGKTLTAVNLAISLAKELTCTVLLVDADLRNPGIHDYFGLTPQYGLGDYLTGDVPLSDLLVNPAGINRLVVLPGGKPLTNSTEMLNSPKMMRLVDELKTRYTSRIVLFDVAPLLASADTLAFAPYVDAALLVIEAGKTSADDAKRATELLQNTQLIGTVLNKSRSPLAPAADDAEQDWSARLLERLRNSKLIDRIAEKTQHWTNRALRKKS